MLKQVSVMHYIQRKDSKQLETVDEFETYREAAAMCNEYSVADPTARYYVSKRPCKSWKESN
jgi:hypothetical protein